MFYNPFAGFRDPNDPFGLLQQAAASVMPEIAPPSPSLGFPQSPMSPGGSEITRAPPTDERRVPLPPTLPRIPEVVRTGPAFDTPKDERLVPTAASQAPPAKSFEQRMMDMYKDPKFGPALASLVKGMGGGASAPAPPTARAPQIAAGNPGYHQPDAGAGAKLTELGKKWGQFGPKPKRQRQDDPHDREQDTYDWRRAKGRG